MARTLYLPPEYPEQSADHEFPVEVVELVRAAAGPEEIRRTWIEAPWWEQDPTELAMGRPVRAEGKRPRRVTYVAIDTLTFEIPKTSLDPLILDLAPKLQKRGYTVYGHLEGLRELAPPKFERIWTSLSSPDTLILTVIQAKDPYEPLRIHGPGSSDILVKDLIQALEEWKGFSSFELAIASYRVLDLVFRKLPPNLKSFAEAVYELDPQAVYGIYLGDPVEGWDTLDYIRATNSQKPANLVRSLRKSKRLRLFWE